ncbi:hypothetical protein LTS12_027290, partial [Elasticomyces elasticus]
DLVLSPTTPLGWLTKGSQSPTNYSPISFLYKDYKKLGISFTECTIMGCAECERRGRIYVSTSLDSLDSAEDELVAKIGADKQKVDHLLGELVAAKSRIERNEKLLEAASKRTQKKLACLLQATPLDVGGEITAEDAVLEES